LDAVLPLRLLGSVCESFSGVNALLEPIQHLILNPSHPAWTEFNPLGESPGQFKARNVLGRVQNQLLQLTLR
jgi:hypothetical protein